MLLLSRKNQRFAKEQAPYQSTSLTAMTLRRFRKDTMAMVSTGVILLFTLMAILGYLITPDHTPYCNQQYLELAMCRHPHVDRRHTYG